MPDREAIPATLDVAMAARVREQIETIRRHGFMAAIGDQNPGVGGLSVPVFGIDGVMAAVTISSPSERWSMDAMLSAAPGIIETV